MTPFSPNINYYLKDIPGPSPVGEYLKYQDAYDIIPEKMREDLDLPQGVWVQDLKTADWKGAEALCNEILLGKSKDLQIAAWLTEIWMSLYQLPGLKFGLELIEQLSEKYWDQIYPTPVEGDQEFRLAPFLWLNQKLTARLHRLFITAPTNSTLFPKTFGEYLQVRDFLQKKPSSLDGDMARNVTDFQGSLSKTPTDSIKTLNQAVEQVIADTVAMEKFLDSKFQKDAPTLYHMREVLNEFLKFFQETLVARGEEEKLNNTSAEEEATMTTDNTQDSNGRAGGATIKGPFKTREDAYKVIQEAADYLYKIEPHSPTPFLIRKAIVWGNMSFEDLMTEVIQDQGSVGDMRRLLGLDHQPQQPSESAGRSEKSEKTMVANRKLPWSVEHSG